MKKLTKFGIITMSVFALNLVSQSVVQADETNSEPAATLVTPGVTNTTGSENSAPEDNNVAEGTSNGEAATTEISQPVLQGLYQALTRALGANQMAAISLMRVVTSMLKDFQHILVKMVKV